MNTYLDWTNFKAVVILKNKVRYTENPEFYTIFYTDNAGTFSSSIIKDDGADQTDFEANYKSLANAPVDNPIDSDNSIIVRNKAAKAGWTYQLTAGEITTSLVGSLVRQDVEGNNLTDFVIKFYDDEDNELTTQGSCDTDCIKTVVTFEPTWNYELIGGTIKAITTVTEDVRVWVIGVPDIPAEYGGSKVMVQGINLKFVDANNGINADGRVSKFMTYSDTYHTNKLKVVFKHPVGHKEPLMIAFEVFKA